MVSGRNEPPPAGRPGRAGVPGKGGSSEIGVLPRPCLLLELERDLDHIDGGAVLGGLGEDDECAPTG